jgi:hypothetical protein
VADKIAKKLPKRVSRGKGAWVALARGRDSKNRVLVNRNARQGINFPDLGHVGSAAYRRRRPR